MHHALPSRVLKIGLFTLGLALAACEQETQVDDAGPDVVDAGQPPAECVASSRAALPCAGDGGACVTGVSTAVSCAPTVRNYATAAGAAGAGYVLLSTRRDGETSTWDTHLFSVGADGGASLVQNPTGSFDGGQYGSTIALAPEAWDAPALFWQGDGTMAAHALVYAGDGGTAETVFEPGDAGSIGLARAAMAPDGTVYALGIYPGGWTLATRDAATGTWSNTAVPGSSQFPGWLTVGPDGRAYTAQWSPDSDPSANGTLTLGVGGAAPTEVLRDLFRLGATHTVLAVGHDAGGAPEPVIAYDNYGTGVFLAVPDGAGGYRKLTVVQPGVADTCPHGAVHFSCDECHAPACSVLGDSIYDISLAVGPDGAVWLAYLMVHYDVANSVNAVPETAGGQTIGCDCQITLTADNTHATEVVFARVTTGANAAVEPRARLAVAGGVRTVSVAQRDGVFHVLTADYADTTNVVAVHTAVAASMLP